MKKIQVPPLVELLRMFLKQCGVLVLAVVLANLAGGVFPLLDYYLLKYPLLLVFYWPLLVYVMGFSVHSLKDEDGEKDKDKDKAEISFIGFIRLIRMCLKTALVFLLAIVSVVFIDDANDFSLTLFYSLLAVFWVLSTYIMGARWVTLKVALGVDEEEDTTTPRNQEEDTATPGNQEENTAPSSQAEKPPA